MTALMKLLTDTLPMAAVECSLNNGNVPADRRGEAFRDVRKSSLLRYMTFVDPVDQELAWFKGWEAGSSSRLWSIDKASLKDPASVIGVRCRVPGNPTQEYKVFEKVAFGRDRDGVHEPSVQARWFRYNISTCTNETSTVDLPLTREFLWAQWIVKGAELSGGTNDLWLETQIDLALQRVFVFDIVPDSEGAFKVVPLAEDSIVAKSPDVISAGLVRDEYREINLYSQDDPLLNLIRDIDFLPFSVPHYSVNCEVGKVRQVDVAPIRIVVSCSLTLCAPAADFEPSGTARVARFYPHIMVISSVNLNNIDTAVMVQRPSASVDRLASSPTDSEPAVFPAIDMLMVAHANEAAIKYATVPPVPVWDNVFNYCHPGASSFIGKQLRVVDRTPNGSGARSDASGWIDRTRVFETRFVAEQTPYHPADLDIALGADRLYSRPVGNLVSKVAAQGALDGISLGPVRTISSSSASWSWLGDFEFKSSIDAKWQLNDVFMMPLLGSDNVFIGWRWSDTSTRSSTWGWDDDKPYQVAGAPMVPPGQKVGMRPLGPHSLIYAAVRVAAPSLEWVCFMHHGGGVCIDDSLLRAFYVSSLLELRAGALTLDGVQPIVFDSALLSWRLRFATEPHVTSVSKALVVSGTLDPEERTKFNDLAKAMIF